MEVPDDIDMEALDPVAAKSGPERYVYLWLLKMCRSGPSSITFRRSEPLPCVPEPEFVPPTMSFGFAEVANTLKVMAGLGEVPCPRPVDAWIDLSVSGAPAVAHVHFDDQSADPWCQVTIDQPGS